MTVLSCPIPGCGFTTEDVDVIGAAAIMNVHSHIHAATNAPRPAGPAIRAPKLERPKLQMNSTTEDWNAFVRRWETYRTGSSIPDNVASGQLLECTEEQLGNIVLRAKPNFTTLPLNDALTALKKLAVIPVALGVVRSELLAMRQDPDEPFRTFAARVQGKAETCEFKTVYDGLCSNCDYAYNGEVYYTDEVIRDVLLHGIADIDIRRDALSADDIQEKPVTDVIAYVENKETARNANPVSSVTGLSAYRRGNRLDDRRSNGVSRTRVTSPSEADKTKTANCTDCHKVFNVFKKKSRGWNRKPHTRCESCWKKNRDNQQRQTSEHSAISNDTLDPFGQVGAITSDVPPPPLPRIASTVHPKPSQPIEHQIFTKGEWRRARVTSHPTVNLRISLDKQKSKPVDVVAVADTGAQSDIWSLEHFLKAGFKMSDLSPATLSLNAANKSPIKIDGVFHARLTGRSNEILCRSMIYVSRDVKCLYLSYDSMLQLGIINSDFPTVGKFSNTPYEETLSGPQTATAQLPVGSICGATKDDGGICDCPPRTAPPPRPKELPFPCTPENSVRMREWLLSRYGSSTFNTCSHQQLPCMDGPPVEIHIKDDAVPVAHHKAIPVPIHWREKVYADLHRDVALDVIEPVPLGEPSEWCHHMVVARKHDGSPRRTVDLSPLNKFCKRETHNPEQPFHVVRRIPRNTWKTVMDAWNGYHSLPLRESDRHLTTFITPIGRFRYKRAPQGFLSSGDGYNRRFDTILADFNRKERIVDDTLHYDENLTEHWWRTIDLLTLIGNSGIVVNPEKFQFAQKEVDFAGFRITPDRIDPLPKYFNAIRNFPTPSSTTDIRSWFGLVNQVSNYAQLRDHMEPFRKFLSPRTPFEWNEELDTAFKSSKEAIIDAIKEGVEIFDLGRTTGLRTDWSKKGIGYFLLQKHCSCQATDPDCCSGGWRITLASSRFLSSAEKHYVPIEGEALAITWGLEQTKFFTLGCPDLTVITDHKPLVKIYGDKRLDEIRNTRLVRLKQRTLPWYFKIIHLPGKTNPACDATSRYPSSSDDQDAGESMFLAAIQRQTNSVTSITWEQLIEETNKDDTMQSLIEAINTGFPPECRDSPTISQYWQYRESLHVSDGVVIYDDRAVIPTSLRPVVLDALHAAHQGVSMMGSRARAIVFWPGMTADIERTRKDCRECIANAPSQPDVTVIPSPPPSTPFEKVFADFFEIAGRHYLVVGDRLSGWSDVFTSPHGSPQSGAAGLISCLRNYFARFGVAEEITSDGGPEFVASATEEFLKRWGVSHRLSSAYFPQSNGRAEVAVKSTKRLLRANTGPSGSLDTDRFLRAMMQMRNTPDPDCNISPAQIVFGRPIRDAFAFINRLVKYDNQHVRPLWRDAWAQKESALKKRFFHSIEKHDHKTHSLPSLNIGDHCYIQNQSGNYPKRWDRSGVVVESHGFESYTLKVDGSGRLTRRNRKHLRCFSPANQGSSQEDKPPSLPAPPTLNLLRPSTSSKASGSQPSVTRQSLPTPPKTPQESTNNDTTITEGPVPPVALDAPTTPNMTVSSSPTEHNPLLGTPPQHDDAPSRFSTRVRRPPKQYEPETGKWV